MIVAPRLPDWRARFEAEIDSIKFVPFDWGAQFDCWVGLAARVAFALTGVDHAAPYRGRYVSPEGALRVMKRAGHDNLADLVASHLPEIHPSQAALGDIAAIPMEDPFGFSVGVVNGERVFVLRPEGIGTVGLLDATRAFRVG